MHDQDEFRIADGTFLREASRITASDGTFHFQATVDQPAEVSDGLVLVRLDAEDIRRLGLEHEYAWVPLEFVSRSAL